jgi:hypothetical protein
MLFTPSLDEIQLQAAKIGLQPADAEAFYHHYEAVGWRYGRNPIVSWTHALSGWKLRGDKFNEMRAATNSTGSFWADTKRLELVEKELKAIEARASHTAFGMKIEARDSDKWARLRTERKALKLKMNL